MKHKELKEKDIKEIKQFAHTNWVRKAHTGDNFVCKCYVEAFIRWLSSKNLTVKDGKIYAEEKDSKTIQG